MAYAPLANGIHTDHPIPGLPFVDDSILDLEDRSQIERLGRRPNTDMWGREDLLSGSSTDWTAFTTIPEHTDLAWIVRHYEDHGTTVVLVADDDAAALHETDPTPVLTRAGGYFWDGTTWYRPEGTYDRVTSKTNYTPVPDATTVTVSDVLKTAQPHEPKPLTPLEEVPTTPAATHEATPKWVMNHLSAWLSAHPDPDAWARAVVTLRAPELESGRMLNVAAVADYAGLSQGAIRSYLAREQMPEPQTREPSVMWAAPVIAEWRTAVANRQAPEVEVINAAKRLEAMVRDLDTTRKVWGRLTAPAVRGADIAKAISRHTLGINDRGHLAKVEILAQYLASELDPVTRVTGEEMFLMDPGARDMIVLIETDPSAMEHVIPRAVKIRLEEAKREAERLDLRATVEETAADRDRLQAEADHRAAEEAGDSDRAEQATSARDYAQARMGWAATGPRAKADRAKAALEDGTTRRRIEDAFRDHLDIRERPDLRAWMEYVLTPRAL